MIFNQENGENVVIDQLKPDAHLPNGRIIKKVRVRHVFYRLLIKILDSLFPALLLPFDDVSGW